MILTEEFVNKQCSDNAQEFFRMATSLGYTILCPEDETGSLKRGFMLQNQYGALYSCPVGETAIETMMPILRFVIDFERAGASASARPIHIIDQMEECIGKIEKLLADVLAPEAQASGTGKTTIDDPKKKWVAMGILESDTGETTLDKLKKRAQNIGNRITDRLDGRLMYWRSRQSDCRAKGPHLIFTDDNILETQQDRWHINNKWTFEQYELAELEATIAHDERLYAEHFTD